ncbi:hypothetical protein GH811_06795 [Acetobacterium malicum]|uniref:TerB-C domain-containing protein n=1 Tax=Acetobacterium malicum TaxID=52692 RepID=A0ABR6YVU6_9FIRM|nr:TerB N-terminal domain-containing protein [Acetobacterium malicum]MBC3899319.1 hypothetical protein [Acetobacterium malicum]
MNKTTPKLPGTGMRILSFVPVVNCILLVYLGISYAEKLTLILGGAYFLISLIFPDVSPLIWLVVVIHYIIFYRQIKKKMVEVRKVPSENTTVKQIKNTLPEKQIFSDITLSGKVENKQTIPEKGSTATIPFTVSVTYLNPHEEFFEDIKKYADKKGAETIFVPFMSYWPSYQSMSGPQRKWYFYWRSEIRKKNYLDTDLSYIFIYIYELLNGVGYQTPDEGYTLLLEIWEAYREAFPKLNNYLYDWTFDFAYLNRIEPSFANYESSFHKSSYVTDTIIEQHRQDVPLKISFELVDALCDYSIKGSKFYQSGYHELMKEAIPRIVSLADAFLRKKSQQGLLETFGPEQAVTKERYLYRSALCPQANQTIFVTIKEYSSASQLRNYVNQLVRFGENTLREIYGTKGRLRGIAIDEETGNLIASFLKREYGLTEIEENKGDKPAKLELNFEDINDLRKQSDAVRSILQVEDAAGEEMVAPTEKILLTEVEEVITIYKALSENERAFLKKLYESEYEAELMPVDTQTISAINRLADRYLQNDLISVEGDQMIIEDDFRDEIDYLFKNPPEIEVVKENQADFDKTLLPENLQEFVTELLPEQRQSLIAVLTLKEPEIELERIAEETMTMPELLIDDINALAINILGDIIIEKQLEVVAEYAVILKKSLRGE